MSADTAGAEAKASRAAGHERVAVRLSFWVGGVGLALLKAVVFAATKSSMVRTSMFESIGDVISSAIMAITHWQMSNRKDAHRYPVGKARFAPLGVLFFCAFMVSQMSGTAIDSLQSLVEEQEPDGRGELAADTVRRLFKDRPRLHWAYPWGDVESLASKYSAEFGGSVTVEDDADRDMAVTLMGVCVVVKLLLYCYCRVVGRKQGSEIVRALGADHLNDTATNALIICTMAATSILEKRGHGGHLVDKLDPLVSLLLSLYIAYGWVTNAQDQLKALNDRRACDDDVDVAALREAAAKALEGASLECWDVHAYNAGEGCRLIVDLRPATGRGSAGAVEERLANALQRTAAAVRAAAGDGMEVLGVEMRLAPRALSGASAQEV